MTTITDILDAMDMCLNLRKGGRNIISHIN